MNSENNIKDVVIHHPGDIVEYNGCKFALRGVKGIILDVYDEEHGRYLFKFDNENDRDAYLRFADHARFYPECEGFSIFGEYIKKISSFDVISF